MLKDILVAIFVIVALILAIIIFSVPIFVGYKILSFIFWLFS